MLNRQFPAGRTRFVCLKERLIRHPAITGITYASSYSTAHFLNICATVPLNERTYGAWMQLISIQISGPQQKHTEPRPWHKNKSTAIWSQNILFKNVRAYFYLYLLWHDCYYPYLVEPIILWLTKGKQSASITK